MNAGATDYAKLIAALDRAGVEFIVIGGLAANAHGSPRFTQDVDVVYSRADDNLARLVHALAPLNPYLRGAPPGLPFEWSVQTLVRGLNFTLTTTDGSLDILGKSSAEGGMKTCAHTPRSCASSATTCASSTSTRSFVRSAPPVVRRTLR